MVTVNFMLLYLSHHLAKWAQTLRADRACLDLALACTSNCLSSHSHGCWGELYSVSILVYTSTPYIYLVDADVLWQGCMSVIFSDLSQSLLGLNGSNRSMTDDS